MAPSLFTTLAILAFLAVRPVEDDCSGADATPLTAARLAFPSAVLLEGTTGISSGTDDSASAGRLPLLILGFSATGAVSAVGGLACEILNQSD